MILGSIIDLTAKAITKVMSIVKKGGKARVLDEDENVKEDEIYYQGIAIEVPDDIAKESINLSENLSDDTLAIIVTDSIQDVDGKVQDWEVPDESIELDSGRAVKPRVRKESTNKPVFPDGWSVAYYPAGGEGGGKPNLQYIKEWVENVKLSNMSSEDLSFEYSRVMNKPQPNGVDSEKRSEMVDSITYMVARKIWYVGRRSADFTDHEWNEHTKDMRPPEGSFGKNDVWTNIPFPYGQEYVYTSGDLHKAMSDFKITGKLSY
jgi:hypothetical protein